MSLIPIFSGFFLSSADVWRKKFLPALWVIVFFSAAASASAAAPFTTIASDSFNYSAGTLAAQNGGTGWTTAWAGTYGSGGVLNVNTTGFTYTGLTTSGGRAVWGSGGNGISQAERSLPLMDNGIVYLQFLSQLESGSSGGGTPNIRLRNSGTLTGGIGGNGGTYGSKVSILDDGLSAKSDGSSSSSANLNSLNLVIVRINYNTVVTDMWVNPNLATFDYESPPTADATYASLAPVFNQLELITRNPGEWDELLIMQAPVSTVTAINPTSGSATGGTAVTITGTNFTDATAVTIGGVAATGITVVNATTITATTGAHAAGAVDVQVTVPGGTGTGVGLYTYIASNTAPAITSNGGGATASMDVAENSTGVTTVVATDAEVPATQSLTYSKSGADAGLFTLNPTSGELSFTAAPDYESPEDADTNNIYQVTVTATDNGSPNLSDSQDLTITVTNVNEAPSFFLGSNQLAYETVTPSRVSNNIVYSVNNAAALAATSFNRVTYRMETRVSGVLRYAETSFDAWSGLTVAALQVPTPNAPATIQRNVTNLTVDSNYPGVVNASGQSGRLEIWDSNYSQIASGGVDASSSAYDFDDTPTVGSHGCFQVHNLSSTPKQTVLAWNNHGVVSPDIGFGNQPTGEPDWTFANANGLGSTDWKLQIFIGERGLPSTFNLTEDVSGDLLFYSTPFLDDSPELTVTLEVADGIITGNAGTGIVVGGTATARTFTGSVSDLNAYFTTSGKVTYLGALNNNSSRSLTISVSDGSLSDSTVSTINLSPVNDTPTDIALAPSSIAENNAAGATVGTLSTTDVDAGDTFTYTLVSGTGSADNGSFTIAGDLLKITPSADYETKNSYSIRIRATDSGSLFYEKEFTISITDVDEMEIVISGNSVEITDGDSTPDEADHTDFGSTPVSGGSVARTFTISNTGPAVLTLTGIAPDYVTLSGSSDFTVTSQPTSPVAATTGTTTFVVTFDPSSEGLKTAEVSLTNDDADENPYTFTISGTGLMPEPVLSVLGEDVVTGGAVPGADGTTEIGSFDLLRRGGFLAENGYLVFPGQLLIGSGLPAVTVDDAFGLWKTAGGNLYMLARTGTSVPDVSGALFDTLPEVPGISAGGEVSFLGSMVIGSGAVTSSSDTGLWSELGGSGLSLLMREDDDVPSLTGVKVNKFASGLFATATTGASTGEAVFSVIFKGDDTKTAILRASVNGATTTISVVAHEGTQAPGTAVNYANLSGSYSDPGRMDAQGNFVYSALTTPGSKEGIWYQPVAGGTPAKVFFAGDVAPGTSGATFAKIKRPSIGSNGFITFRASLNKDGDNAANARNDGIWAGDASNPASISCILRRGDDNSVVANLPGGALVGNPWGGWLTSSNRGAWKAWLDTDGNGTSASPTDVHAIYTNLSGVMLLAVKAGDAAPGTTGATFSGFDLPFVGGSNQYAFLGTLTGGDTVPGNNQGLWKSAANGGALNLVLRKGDDVITTEGSKTVSRIDLPGSNQTDRRWAQPVMDNSGRMVIYITFTDGSTSQILVP